MQPVPPRPLSSSGFTLIELLVVIVIASILGVMAVPSFLESIERNRIVSQNNELLTTFTYARSEAIRRNRPISVCALDAAGTGCAADNWNRGWLVWSDEDRSGTFNAGDETLRINRLDARNRLDGAGVFDIRFSARGTRILPTADVVLELQPDGCKPSRPHIRNLTVRATGSVSSQEDDCP